MTEEIEQSSPQADERPRAATQQPDRNAQPRQTGRKKRPQADMVAMDGSALKRPQIFQGAQWLILAAIVLVAAIIGYNVYSTFMDNVIYASEREQAAVDAQLSRNVTLDLPTPDLLIGCSDAEIVANFAASGYVTFENEVADGTSLEIIKLPSDMTVEQGKALYSQGINKLSGSDAAKILNGLWRLDVSRSDSTVMRLRYADFKSGSVEAALTSAMAAQGLTEDSVTDSGTDDSGNTYKTGTAAMNGYTVTWRISAIDLSEIYSIRSLPSTAVYIGIRYTY